MSEIREVSREGPRRVAPALKRQAGRAGAGTRAAAKGEALGERVAAVNATLARIGVKLKFQLSTESDEVVILVVDAETDEVVKKVPPDYFLRASGGFADGAPQPGILVDEGV